VCLNWAYGGAGERSTDNFELVTAYRTPFWNHPGAAFASFVTFVVANAFVV